MSDCVRPEIGWENGNGYIRMSVDGRKVYAHRYFYELAHGPVPDGLMLDHLCRNRWCSNVSHLEPVTNEENILRGESPPAQNARRESCPQGHEYRKKKDGTRTCGECRQQTRTDTKRLGIGRPADRTHCPQGHPYDEENTYEVKRPDGSIKQRMCRECSRQRVRARRQRARG